MDDLLSYVPLGFAQATSIGTASAVALPGIGSPAAIPAGAGLCAVIVAEAQAVMWRDDGTAPTPTVGMPLGTGVEFDYAGTLSKIQFIGQAAGATLNVSYYKKV
jgi:hypothetical protein